MAARGYLLPGANVCVAAPLVRSAAKSPPLPLQVGPLKSSYMVSGERCKLPHRGLGRSSSENRIWCILALRRSGQTRKVPNNCQAVSGVTVRPSYCAGISSVSYCSRSLLTKPPNPFCSANADSPEAEFPNSPPNAAPAQCRPGRMPPFPPPLR